MGTLFKKKEGDSPKNVLMKAEELENYPIKKRGISKSNNAKEGAGNYSSLKI